MVPRAVAFTIVWPEGVIFGSIMTYHVQFLLLVRQPLFDRAALPLTQTSWVLPPLSVGKMTLRLYSALNYSHGLSKGPSFGTGRGQVNWSAVLRLPTQLLPVGKGSRQQPPRRCQESILPGNAFPPVVGDGVQAVEGAGELPSHCCYRIGVVGQVGREQHRAAEVSGAGD